ncbi:unnamed protein product, partial [Staurois parvus]
MTERGQRMLIRTVSRSCQLSAESIAKNLQTSCGLQTGTTTAAFKPYITKCNAKRWMQCCKAHCHWILEQWR